MAKDIVHNFFSKTHLHQGLSLNFENEYKIKTLWQVLEMQKRILNM